MDLTDRELQMFTEMSCGPTNKQLSAGLGITIRTVKFHLENIRIKLGGLSRLQMCLLAVHHRIATCPAGHV
ncbi:helix-turn-helix transcriptional regulator [Streptomyces sp. NPDC006326]|uniref:helix-turn-helix domain-containing protein n=1 Tax=Streptomyces sp. NPDC006326 TaxID=3156752 RepID=UPI0033BA1315